MGKKSRKKRKRTPSRRNRHKRLGKKLRKRSRKKGFVKDRCAPKISNEKLEFSCYTRNSLHKLKNLWNARHRDNMIKSNNPLEIWQALKYAMAQTCNRESCWLKQKVFREGLTKDMRSYTFAPEPPKVVEE